MFLNIDNLKIYYDKKGEGLEILLIHGWGIDSNSLNSLAIKLSNKYKVYLVDLPGFGMSEPLDNFDSYKLAEIIEKFIKKLNLNIFMLIGHSLGAKVCSILASKGYGNKLVLIGSPGINYKRSFAIRFKNFIVKFVRIILEKVFFIKEESKIFKFLRSKVGSTDYKNASEDAKKSFKKIICEDLSSVFSKIEIETLIIQGKEDKQVPVEVAYKISSLIKKSTLVIIEKGDHFCYNDPIFLENLNKFSKI